MWISVRSVARRIAQGDRKYRDFARVSDMDEHMLRDIGLTRHSVRERVFHGGRF